MIIYFEDFSGFFYKKARNSMKKTIEKTNSAITIVKNDIFFYYSSEIL